MNDKCLYAIKSVRIVEIILGFEINIEVIFKEDNYFSSPDISAVFIKDGHYIVFNNSFLKFATIPEIIITGFHEARHAYQNLQVEILNYFQFNFKEDVETINKWKLDFDNQKLVSKMTRYEYLNQTIEIDAIAFSSYLTNKLLNLNQTIPDEIKGKVMDRISQLNQIIKI